MGSNRGAALLIVLAIVALLSVAVVQFQREARVERTYAANTLAALEAQGLVRSGAAAGVALIRAEDPDVLGRDGYWNSEVAHLIPVSQNTVSLKIEDQYGKFPLGALIDKDGVPVLKMVDAYKRLLEGMELEDIDIEELTWALVDWIDDDSTDDQYEFNENFVVPNSPIEHLDELGKITGYDQLAPETLAAILSYLDTRAEAEVNVNTASVPMLMGLTPTLTIEEAEDLYAQLGEAPAEAEAAISGIIPISARAMKALFSSNRIRLILSADVRDVRREADCILEKDKDDVFRIADWTQN